VPAYADGASSIAKENKDELSVAVEDISSGEPSVAKQELAPSIRRSGFSIRKIALMFLAILALGLVALFITDIPY